MESLNLDREDPCAVSDSNAAAAVARPIYFVPDAACKTRNGTSIKCPPDLPSRSLAP
jgi:hypothetical protein